MKLSIFLVAAITMLTTFYNRGDITITGKVTNTKGQPIVAATIQIDTEATQTATDGSYSITFSSSTNLMKVSSVGYESKKIKINGRTLIDIQLKEAVQALNEVAVTGYGRSDDSEEHDGVMNKSLAGRVAGLKSQRFAAPAAEFNTKGYSNIVENKFHKVNDEPLSTFSIDVDAASYSNLRRFLNSGQLPPAGAVRTEEMINYFKYEYPQPAENDPFSINTEMATCPWNKNNQLLLIGLQGKEIPTENLPASNLVFLIDVSGSMTDENKLPLVKSSLNLLTGQLREEDRISIVVYAGNAGLVLPPTSGSNKQKIRNAIHALEAGGSTAGGAGIKLAYNIATGNFKENGNNRIILCTDGDFNVGESSDDAMVRLIEKEREKGIFLTVLGFGMGNYQDSKMQQLADKGNGNHAYIDGLNEAKKVLISEFGGTLFTIAKDVKIQIEFNPGKVAGYRLIGYENRILEKEDFNDDKKDAGELGSGHTVTALYEIIPAGVKSPFLKDVDPLKYQRQPMASTQHESDEIATVKFRYKLPVSSKSELIVHPVTATEKAFHEAGINLRFAASVASFAMLLRDSEFKGTSNFEDVIYTAKQAIGKDNQGYRHEFISLVETAQELSEQIGMKTK